MTAILADGERPSDQQTVVPPPNNEGNIRELVSAPPPIVPQPNPIALLHGTDTAVENPVANSPSERFDDNPRRRTHHDLPPPLLTLPPDTLHLPVNPTTINDSPSSRIDLDALERKIRSIGEKIDRLLSVTDGAKVNDDDTPYQRLLKAASDPTLPPVDMDALERKIRSQLLSNLDAPTPEPPTPSSDLSPYGHYPGTSPRLQLDMNPAVHPDHATTTPALTHPIAKPRVPPDPHQPAIPNLLDTDPIVNNNLPVPQPLRPTLRRKPPPSLSALPSKRARITSYLCTLPGGPPSPSPSIPLPPFNPVLMCTSDKYTQHNFRPP